MRKRILTDNEREIIEAYLNDGTKLEGFRTLKFRVNHVGDKSKILNDLELINKFKNKYDLIK